MPPPRRATDGLSPTQDSDELPPDQNDPSTATDQRRTPAHQSHRRVSDGLTPSPTSDGPATDCDQVGLPTIHRRRRHDLPTPTQRRASDGRRRPTAADGTATVRDTAIRRDLSDGPATSVAPVLAMHTPTNQRLSGTPVAQRRATDGWGRCQLMPCYPGSQTQTAGWISFRAAKWISFSPAAATGTPTPEPSYTGLDARDMTGGGVLLGLVAALWRSA